MRLFSIKQTLEGSGILRGFTDWHSHILPGVDDGVQSVDESLDILRLYESSGIETVWLTPHIMEDIPNTTASLRERFDRLRSAYTGPVRLRLASENMIDALFEERLEAGDLLPIGDEGDRLLVETSYFNPPMGMRHIMKRIQSKGYHPVLAHPERYVYMEHEDYLRLLDTGVLFQLNLPSLFGGYGPEARHKAEWLLKNGHYSLAGSDIHHLHVWRDLLSMKADRKLLQMACGISPHVH